MKLGTSHVYSSQQAARSLRVRVKFDLGWENGHVTRLDGDSFYVRENH